MKRVFINEKQWIWPYHNFSYWQLFLTSEQTANIISYDAVHSRYMYVTFVGYLKTEHFLFLTFSHGRFLNNYNWLQHACQVWEKYVISNLQIQLNFKIVTIKEQATLNKKEEKQFSKFYINISIYLMMFCYLKLTVVPVLWVLQVCAKCLTSLCEYEQWTSFLMMFYFFSCIQCDL